MPQIFDIIQKDVVLFTYVLYSLIQIIVVIVFSRNASVLDLVRRQFLCQIFCVISFCKDEFMEIKAYMDLQHFIIQSTLVISKSKGPSKTLRDIRTSTYQTCRIEENTSRTTKFHN